MVCLMENHITLNGSMEAVSQLINISVQPQESFIPYHLHNYIELTTPLMGQCTVEVNQQKITLNPGDVILIGNQTVHRVENIDQQTVVVNIEIRPGAFNINELETIHNQQGISTMLLASTVIRFFAPIKIKSLQISWMTS